MFVTFVYIVLLPMIWKESICMVQKLGTLRSFSYVPRTMNQQKYVDSLQNNYKSLVVAIGPAGSGKTLFACSQAMKSLKRGEIQKVLITRPLVPVDEEEIGFLPGTLNNKMDPWVRPMMDSFREIFSATEITKMIQVGTLEIVPLAFLRGRTFHETFVIADEMQNASPSQMLMLMTRMGQESKLVITGDMQQSDLSIEKNGLNDFVERYERYLRDIGEYREKDIALVRFNTSDIFRSSLVHHILDIYQTTDRNQKTVESQMDHIVPLRDYGRPYLR